jgi:hypothetical protein
MTFFGHNLTSKEGEMATFRQLAWDIALDRRGYVTTVEARASGIPVVELAKIAHRGLLRHVAHGIYRFDEFPTTRLDQFYEALLRVGEDAYLVGDAVLALYDLAQVNPKRLRVATTQRRLRKDLPDWIAIEKAHVEEHEITVVEGIRSSTLRQALVDARPYVMHERLLDAIESALKQDLISESDEQSLRKLLGEGGF